MPPARKTTPEPAPEPTVDLDVRPRGVAAKLAWVQQNITNVEKTGFNPAHSYAYMQEHGLIQVLRPALREVGLAVAPSPAENNYSREQNRATLRGVLHVIDTDERPYLTSPEGWPMLNSVTGELLPNPDYELRLSFPNEGADSQDKATNKALTGWMKYALQKTFLVPTEHVDDADRAEGPGVTPSAPVAAAEPELSPEEAASIPNADQLGESIKALVGDGKIDPNKATAKLQTFKTRAIRDLTPTQRREMWDWAQAQAGIPEADRT